MNRRFLAAGTLFGALSVILGAFAAHGLKNRLPADAVAVFETGVRYQFFHGFALLFTGMLSEKFPGKWLQGAGYLFITGIILFSGSLYALTVYQLTGITGLTFITAILTPFGGLFFIAGWFFLLAGIYRK